MTLRASRDENVAKISSLSEACGVRAHVPRRGVFLTDCSCNLRYRFVHSRVCFLCEVMFPGDTSDGSVVFCACAEEDPVCCVPNEKFSGVAAY
jgi:hypothetical protein